ncbi:hypothetical protein M9H77_13030 [Catharanthus roseus]|uniref:Uncharacterized protein n=1 Tax=Catharanthus roseus TaxID=4058 RepID=A0ACC0BJ44_CATRO|nr:hypothetical protein M9H77_13030 [Catharanthus roseus]
MVKVKGLEMSISASTIVLEPTQLARLGYQSYQEKEMEAHVDLASLKAQFQNFSTSTGIKLSKQWASIDQPFDLVETAKVKWLNDASVAPIKRLILDHCLSFICMLEPLLDSSKQPEVNHNISFDFFCL